MPESAGDLLARLRADPSARESFHVPVLLWEAPTHAQGEHWEQTLSHSRIGALLGDPLVFRVEKNPHTTNPFAFGVTLGRVNTNDLVIEDESVSRFHAFLKQDGQAWSLTDAESKNGTWVDAIKLDPNQPRPLRDGAVLRLGDAQLTFLLAPSFLRLLDPPRRR